MLINFEEKKNNIKAKMLILFLATTKINFFFNKLNVFRKNAIFYKKLRIIKYSKSNNETGRAKSDKMDNKEDYDKNIQTKAKKRKLMLFNSGNTNKIVLIKIKSTRQATTPIIE